MRTCQFIPSVFLFIVSSIAGYAGVNESEPNRSLYENRKNYYIKQYEEIKDNVTENQKMIFDLFLKTFDAKEIGDTTSQITIYDDLFRRCDEDHLQDPKNSSILFRIGMIDYTEFPLMISRLFQNMNVPVDEKIKETEKQMERSNDSRIHEIYVSYLVGKEQYDRALSHVRSMVDRFPDIDGFKFLWVKTLIEQNSYLFGKSMNEQKIDLQDVCNKGEGIVDFKFEPLAEAISIAKKHVVEKPDSMVTYSELLHNQFSFSDWKQLIDLYNFFKQRVNTIDQKKDRDDMQVKIDERIRSFQKKMQH